MQSHSKTSKTLESAGKNEKKEIFIYLKMSERNTQTCVK